MRPFVFIIFMVSISIVGYWMGNTNMLWTVWTSQGQTVLSATGSTNSTNISAVDLINPANWQNKPTMVFDNIFFWILLLAVGIGLSALGSAIIPGIGQGISFSSFYIFPAIIIYSIFNFVLFPFSFILDPAMPIQISIPIVLLYNILLTMALYTAIRGNS